MPCNSISVARYGMSVPFIRIRCVCTGPRHHTRFSVQNGSVGGVLTLSLWSSAIYYWLGSDLSTSRITLHQRCAARRSAQYSHQ
eukprot:3940640-Rhodomonas_salina.2